ATGVGTCGADDNQAQAGHLFCASLAETMRAGGNVTGGHRPPGTDADTASSYLIAHSLRGEGFDASEDGTGRGTPLVPVAFRTAGDGCVSEEGQTTAPFTTATDPCANIIAFSGKDDGRDCANNLSPTLLSMGHDASHANG